jgi:osmoprotectant transport system ATP-binding protein
MITFQNVAEHYDNGSIEVNGLSLVAPCGNISGCCRPFGLWINRANGYRATAPLKVKPEPGELLEVVGLDPQIAKPSADSFPEASSSAWALPAPWRQTRSLC